MRKPNRKRKNWTIGTLIALSAVLLVALIGMLFCTTLTMELCMDGQNPLTLEYGEDYIDPGAFGLVRSSLFPGFRVQVPVTVSPQPDSNKLGEVTLQYDASYLWLHCAGTRTVIVVDTLAPVITLNGDPDSFTLPGHTYVEEGFTAIDNHDGDITDQVQRTVTDTEIIYTVTDSSGNRAEVRRTIQYNDPEAPVLTLTGDVSIKLPAGTRFNEPGYSATDNCDGDLTASVKVEGTVDIYTPGTYTLTYSVTDAYGNTATATRTIVVELIKQPEVVQPGDKVIYLTFDDGPCSHTGRLLDILEKYNVKATFFVTNQSASYASVMKQIVDEGHSIGVHTYCHDYEDIYVSKEAFFEDFNAMRELIHKHTGIWTTLTRFPGGSSNRVSMNYCEGIMTELAKDLTNMGYQYFDWNVSSGDTGDNKTADAVADAVISQIKKYNVSCVLQHDIRPHSIDAVERIIQWGLANGYTFLPLDSSSPTFHHPIKN